MDSKTKESFISQDRFKLVIDPGAGQVVFEDLMAGEFAIRGITEAINPQLGTPGFRQIEAPIETYKITVRGTTYDADGYTVRLLPVMSPDQELYAESPFITAKSLNNMRDMVHRLAKEKGWWEEGETRTFVETIMLVVTECAEAVEDFRNGKDLDLTYVSPSGIFNTTAPLKPEGIPIELADIIIRVLDIAGRWNIDIGKAFVDKHEYNKTREYRHGGKRL